MSFPISQRMAGSGQFKKVIKITDIFVNTQKPLTAVDKFSVSQQQPDSSLAKQLYWTHQVVLIWSPASTSNLQCQQDQKLEPNQLQKSKETSKLYSLF